MSARRDAKYVYKCETRLDLAKRDETDTQKNEGFS